MAKGEAAANKSVATDSSTATSGSTTAKGGATGWKDHVVTFPPGKPPAEYLAIIDKGLAIAAEALTEGEYDLVVLDEINVALHFGLIAWDKLAAILDQKAEQTEVVLTGRGAPSALMEKADLVTEMKEVKHYYNEGVEARLGIEN
ncbi:MAG: cob(I)yrinic acid a,c-diamide adenosyltransferase [Peptococcaceae bacterium]|nr:cob(I)yrinic acid a,c-diamide adenosyltransferase [Peptococcaceae bacterium]